MGRAGKAIYGTKRWQILRRYKLHLNPVCEHPHCPELAYAVDHITALKDGGAPFDLENVRSLCASHHSQKTRAEMMERAR